MSVEAAVIQFAPTTDKAANLDTIRGYVMQAAEQGADIAVLPEYATYAKFGLDETYVETAEPLDGLSVSALRQLTEEHDIVLVAGVHEPDGNGRIFNTLVAMRNGEIEATYRKIHLYDAFGMRESDWVTPGSIEEPQLIDINGLRFGLQTCYDLRFPEVARMLVDAGANVLVTPAAWVPGPLKETHWMTLLRARAIENTAYVLGADQSAPVGIGHSAIIDPMGIPLALIGDEVGIARAQLNPERLETTRTTNPALTLRRFSTQPNH
ncbi:carbon-nitrogen hydrolase family protein [Enteractinococcus fodinae]|uniref:Amidohydrolase n=1 Tax=Enteractinococcus fodinae TaxID=684663 RepID=A0ABU2AX91_9MICC|nr:carbon-nitrogen hydrolase family protein [Enteractinococcus fodinae]MDR7345957.1 putative amidohydrolase [Enteractinococcus fodinae]